ncbi:D-3-phosphoglycerate dehydrogenase / 2-oxoglutarate reductase [Burkholderiales bacterium]|nr:D-3-phosphoglycerate dehydrogenase / 2-oxoglutarate reductase [Burkholderiales bacterium]
MPRILFADNEFPDITLERELFARHGIEVDVAQCRTEDDVIRAAKGARGILLQYAPITERVVAALPELGIVSRIGAGFDTVDTKACAKHGVWVANSPDYGVGEVATHALALALALVRNIVAWHRDVTAGRWHYTSAGPVRRAADLTLGIVGLGRIGKRMAHVSRNVFRRVVACDPYLIDGDFPAYVERETLAGAFEQADVVSLHVPLNDETRGMVGEREIAALRPGSYLVNTARGAVLDVDAALAALDRGTLAGLALDVLPVEPVPADSRLARHPHVILTPHSAFYSVESERELRRKAAQNLVTWLATGRPEYVVTAGTRGP